MQEKWTIERARSYPPGLVEVAWDGRDDAGEVLPEGEYRPRIRLRSLRAFYLALYLLWTEYLVCEQNQSYATATGTASLGTLPPVGMNMLSVQIMPPLSGTAHLSFGLSGTSCTMSPDHATAAARSPCASGCE